MSDIPLLGSLKFMPLLEEEAPPLPSLNGSWSTSCSLFDFEAALEDEAAVLLLFPSMLNKGSGSEVAAGWNELKKSSPPKSISSFFAFNYLTCPPSYLRANEIPPEGMADVVTAAAGFLPSCMVPTFFGCCS